MMETRLRYLPLSDVIEGMVLGAPVVLAEKGVNSFNLPAGHVLTETNLHQMQLRHAECVCVALPDERSDEERQAEQAVAEMRLQQIFRAADLGNPAMARLYEAVLAYRSL
jgi:hypothetical protein